MLTKEKKKNDWGGWYNKQQVHSQAGAELVQEKEE